MTYPAVGVEGVCLPSVEITAEGSEEGSCSPESPWSPLGWSFIL